MFKRNGVTLAMGSMNELSEYLKSERQEQGLSLKAISERAHVSMSMLELLEEGDYDRIGTELLIRNFVRAYCSVLGIDPEPLLEKYAADIHSCDVQDKGIQRYGTIEKTFKRKRRIGVLPVLFLLIATAGGIYGGTWLWKRYESHSLQQSMNTGVYSQQELPVDLPDKKAQSGERDSRIESPPVWQKESQRAAPPEAQRSPEPEVIPGGDKAQETAVLKPGSLPSSPTEVLPEEKPAVVVSRTDAQKHRLVVEADQKTWIQVKTDNKSNQETLLQPGEKREWEAEESMQIVVGNAGGVRMTWDGHAISIPGKPGTVLRFKLPDQKHTE